MTDNRIERKIILFAIIGITIEVLAILGFVYIAQTELAIYGKKIVVTIFLVLMCTFFAVLARLFSTKSLMMLGAIFAIGSGIVIQVLGFYFFPGLSKDVVLLSFENLWRMGIIVALHFCCYMIGIFAAITLQKINRVFKRKLCPP